MKRYTISFVQSRYLKVVVDAETQEEAEDLAYDAAQTAAQRQDCKWITTELEHCRLDDIGLFPVSIDLTNVHNGARPHCAPERMK